jgi:hypothetical protein
VAVVVAALAAIDAVLVDFAPGRRESSGALGLTRLRVRLEIHPHPLVSCDSFLKN